MLKGLYELGHQRQNIRSVVGTLLQKYGFNDDNINQYSAYDIVNNKLSLKKELQYEYLINLSKLKAERLQEALNIIMYSDEFRQTNHPYYGAYKIAEAIILLRQVKCYSNREDKNYLNKTHYKQAKSKFRLAIKHAQTSTEKYNNQLAFAQSLYKMGQFSDFDEANQLMQTIKKNHGYVTGYMQTIATKSRKLKSQK